MSLCVALGLVGCAVNPVTGQSEIQIVSTEQQISIGEAQYVPAQQMQGGQYRVDPAVTEYVRGVGERVARYAKARLPYEFVVLNSSVPNAWALPGGKIAINRGLLLELRNEAELAAVLSHEVVHAAARHGAKQIERGMLLQTAVTATAVTTEGLPLSDTLVSNVQKGAALINLKYGRDAERESDFYGTRFMAEAGYNAYAAVTLQETFLRLSEGRDAQSWAAGLFSSHPPSAERVKNNRWLVERLEEEGYVDGMYGSDRYQAAMRTLKKDAPAYQLMDQSRQAMFDGELDKAADLISQALALEKAEPQFHSLRGEIRARQNRYADAVTNFDRAVALDDQYYAYYLGRGMVRSRMGELPAAEQDLQQSLKWLPTTIAYLELGKVAESRGDTNAATAYYQKAGQSPGDTGQQARARLSRIDSAAQYQR